MDKYFWLCIQTPDARSKRTLIIFPFTRFSCKLWSWKYGKCKRLEQLLNYFWIYPEY